MAIKPAPASTAATLGELTTLAASVAARCTEGIGVAPPLEADADAAAADADADADAVVNVLHVWPATAIVNKTVEAVSSTIFGSTSLSGRSVATGATMTGTRKMGNPARSHAAPGPISNRYDVIVLAHVSIYKSGLQLGTVDFRTSTLAKRTTLGTELL